MIRTQEVLENDGGRIDLELVSPGAFLVILESKIVDHNPANVAQLKKYADYLKSNSKYYKAIRLVYVTKRVLEPALAKEITQVLGVRDQEFRSFSWLELITPIRSERSQIFRDFCAWIGDRMDQTKEIREQQVEDVKEVLAVFTNPTFMRLFEEKNIIVQRNGAPEALYIAVIQTHRPGITGGYITHLCKVKRTRIEQASESWKDCSARNEYLRQGKSLNHEHKVYELEGKPVVLPHAIPMGGKKSQVYFSTTFAEFVSKPTGKAMKPSSEATE